MNTQGDNSKESRTNFYPRQDLNQGPRPWSDVRKLTLWTGRLWPLCVTPSNTIGKGLGLGLVRNCFGKIIALLWRHIHTKKDSQIDRYTERERETEKQRQTLSLSRHPFCTNLFYWCFDHLVKPVGKPCFLWLSTSYKKFKVHDDKIGAKNHNLFL